MKPQNSRNGWEAPNPERRCCLSQACKEAAIDKPHILTGDAETLNERNGWEAPSPKCDVGSPEACKEAATDRPQTLKGDVEAFNLNKRNGWKTPNTKRRCGFTQCQQRSCSPRVGQGCRGPRGRARPRATKPETEMLVDPKPAKTLLLTIPKP